MEKEDSYANDIAKERQRLAKEKRIESLKKDIEVLNIQLANKKKELDELNNK